MVQYMKKIIATVMALSLMLALPQANAATEKKRGYRMESTYSQQYLQYLADLQAGDVEKYGGQPPYPFAVPVGAGASARTRAALPAAYDPRPQGLMSGVRNQNPYGSCWTFSALGALESALIHSGAASTSVDLSESHIVWWVRRQGGNSSGWLGLDEDSGGYAFTGIGYLMSGAGPKWEKDLPYSSFSGSFPSNFDTARTAYDVDAIEYISPQRESIKQAILRDGAVSAMYFDADSARSADGRSYYYSSAEPDTAEPYSGYHAITVVGWSDGYSRSQFGANKPAGDGAWLIKNSWGPYFGDSGYFWISYEDKILFHGDALNTVYGVKSASPAYSGATRYQWDDYGVTDYPVMVEGVSPDGETVQYMTDAYFSNVFDFAPNQMIEKVTFACAADGESPMDYICYYAPTDASGAPIVDPARMTPLVSGTARYTGYHTAYPAAPRAIPAGKGALVIRLTSPDTALSPGMEFTVEYPEYNLHYFRSDAVEGQSFLTFSGETYYLTDYDDNPCNVALRATAVTRGDVNGDKACTAADLTQAKAAALSGASLAYGDVNGDGTVNMLDMVWMKRHIAGLN